MIRHKSGYMRRVPEIYSDKDLKVAGVDEAGRGPLAGPVVAAAVILPPEYDNSEINDSKKISKLKREKLYDEITRNAIRWSAIAVGPRRIEIINIREATNLAMSIAVNKVAPHKAYIDGNMLVKGISCPQETVVKGDSVYFEIAAASIIAKVTRDRLMERLASRYPAYRFEKHSGYPTKLHRELIAEYGICSAHRRTFRH